MRSNCELEDDGSYQADDISNNDESASEEEDVGHGENDDDNDDPGRKIKNLEARLAKLRDIHETCKNDCKDAKKDVRKLRRDKARLEKQLKEKRTPRPPTVGSNISKTFSILSCVYVLKTNSSPGKGFSKHICVVSLLSRGVVKLLPGGRKYTTDAASRRT